MRFRLVKPNVWFLKKKKKQKNDCEGGLSYEDSKSVLSGEAGVLRKKGKEKEIQQVCTVVDAGCTCRAIVTSQSSKHNKHTKMKANHFRTNSKQCSVIEASAAASKEEEMMMMMMKKKKKTETLASAAISSKSFCSDIFPDDSRSTTFNNSSDTSTDTSIATQSTPYLTTTDAPPSDITSTCMSLAELRESITQQKQKQKQKQKQDDDDEHVELLEEKPECICVVESASSSSSSSSESTSLLIMMVGLDEENDDTCCSRNYGSIMMKETEAVAMVKSSYDPHRDFKDSMTEMVVAKQLSGRRQLQQLLQCYLSLNADEYHPTIVKAFHELCSQLFHHPSSSSSSSSSSA